jgi:hypothetical protein
MFKWLAIYNGVYIFLIVLRQMMCKRLDGDCFTIMYIQEKKQIDGPSNEHVARKSLGHFTWARALGFTLSKEDSQNLCKVEPATESDNWCFNNWLEKIIFYDILNIKRYSVF